MSFDPDQTQIYILISLLFYFLSIIKDGGVKIKINVTRRNARMKDTAEMGTVCVKQDTRVMTVKKWKPLPLIQTPMVQPRVTLGLLQELLG